MANDVLPRAGGVEAFGIERLIGRGHRVRFVVVVDERDAVAHVDGQGRRIVLEIFDANRRDGRKQWWDGGVGAGGDGDGQQYDLQARK